MPLETMCLLSSLMVENKSCMLAANPGCGGRSIKCKLTVAVRMMSLSL